MGNIYIANLVLSFTSELNIAIGRVLNFKNMNGEESPELTDENCVCLGIIRKDTKEFILDGKIADGLETRMYFDKSNKVIFELKNTTENGIELNCTITVIVLKYA